MYDIRVIRKNKKHLLVNYMNALHEQLLLVMSKIVFLYQRYKNGGGFFEKLAPLLRPLILFIVKM